MARALEKICKQLDDGRFLCAVEAPGMKVEKRFGSREAADKRAASLRKRGWEGVKVEESRSFMGRDHDKPNIVYLHSSTRAFAVRVRTRTPWHLK